jgi:hypothetical protein
MLLRRYKQQAVPVKETTSEEKPAEKKPVEQPKAKVSRKK